MSRVRKGLAPSCPHSGAGSRPPRTRLWLLLGALCLWRLGVGCLVCPVALEINVSAEGHAVAAFPTAHQDEGPPPSLAAGRGQGARDTPHSTQLGPRSNQWRFRWASRELTSVPQGRSRPVVRCRVATATALLGHTHMLHAGARVPHGTCVGRVALLASTGRALVAVAEWTSQMWPSPAPQLHFLIGLVRTGLDGHCRLQLAETLAGVPPLPVGATASDPTPSRQPSPVSRDHPTPPVWLQVQEEVVKPLVPESGVPHGSRKLLGFEINS